MHVCMTGTRGFEREYTHRTLGTHAHLLPSAAGARTGPEHTGVGQLVNWRLKDARLHAHKQRKPHTGTGSTIGQKKKAIRQFKPQFESTVRTTWRSTEQRLPALTPRIARRQRAQVASQILRNCPSLYWPFAFLWRSACAQLGQK